MQKPVVLYTFVNEARSHMVILKLQRLSLFSDKQRPNCAVVDPQDHTLLKQVRDGEVVGVALVDEETNRFLVRHFEGGKSRFHVPSWASAATYLVYVGRGRKLSNTNFQLKRAECCANLLAANFGRHFQARLDIGQLPWGQQRQPKTDNFKRRRSRKYRQSEAGCGHTLWT